MTTVPTADDHDPEANELVPPFEIREPGPPPEGVEIAIELVTPEIAADFLRANPCNRRKKPQHIRKLSGAMVRDEFVFNGDPVRQCEHGDLIDGQHRLEAIIESGQSYWMVVIRGLPCAVIHTIDTDMAPRNIQDVLRIRGEAHSDYLASALIWKWRKEVNLLQAKDRPTPAQALAVLDKHEGLRETSAMCHNSKALKLTKMIPGVMAALQYEFHEIDPEDAAKFFTKFTVGAGLEEGDPILVLRNYLQKMSGTDSTGKRKATAVEIYMTVVKAWNAWRGGERVKSIAWVGSKHTPQEPR